MSNGNINKKTSAKSLKFGYNNDFTYKILPDGTFEKANPKVTTYWNNTIIPIVAKYRATYGKNIPNNLLKDLDKDFENYIKYSETETFMHNQIKASPEFARGDTTFQNSVLDSASVYAYDEFKIAPRPKTGFTINNKTNTINALYNLADSSASVNDSMIISKNMNFINSLDMSTVNPKLVPIINKIKQDNQDKIDQENLTDLDWLMKRYDSLTKSRKDLLTRSGNRPDADTKEGEYYDQLGEQLDLIFSYLQPLLEKNKK